MGRTKTIADDELLAVAREAFVESGFAASTKEIARRAGVSEGVLFQRYSTKADLFFAAMVPPVADVQRLLGRRRAAGSPRAHLEKLTFELVDYFRSTVPVWLPLLAHPAFRFDEFARRHPESPMLVLMQELMAFFASERAAGRIGDVEPGGAALLLISTAHSIAIFERLKAHGPTFPPVLIRRAVDCLWEGLRPHSTPRRPRAS